MTGFSFAILLATLVAATPSGDAGSQPDETCQLAELGRDSFCMASDGTAIHLVDWGGAGPTIVLLGGLGSSARIFDELAPMLAEHHRVIALTRRGYGLSDDAAGGDYSNARLASDVLDVMDGIGISRASLVGHSLAGGELAALGKNHPDRVTRLVYLDAAYDRSGVPKIMAGLPTIPPPSASDLEDLAALTRWREGALGSSSAAIAEDLADIMRPGQTGLVPRTTPQVSQAVLAGDMANPPDYAMIAAPSLALYSSKDVAEQVPASADPQLRSQVIVYSLKQIRPWMLRAQAQFLERQRCGVAYEIPKSGHLNFLESPIWTARTILAFLETSDPCSFKVASGPQPAADR